MKKKPEWPQVKRAIVFSEDNAEVPEKVEVEPYSETAWDSVLDMGECKEWTSQKRSVSPPNVRGVGGR